MAATDMHAIINELLEVRVFCVVRAKDIYSGPVVITRVLSLETTVR
jgi:hypothetical protein